MGMLNSKVNILCNLRPNAMPLLDVFYTNIYSIAMYIANNPVPHKQANLIKHTAPVYQPAINQPPAEKTQTETNSFKVFETIF